jgi:hypothetical protein
MPRHDPATDQDPAIPIEAMTPELSAALERAELARTASLDRRLASAGDLDRGGAFELGYDVRRAARRKHRDIVPYGTDDPRAKAYEEGAAMALTEIKDGVDRLDRAFRAIAQLPDWSDPVGPE